MPNITGDIIITAPDGLQGQPGLDFAGNPAQRGVNGINANCDWDSVCRPESSAGTSG